MNIGSLFSGYGGLDMAVQTVLGGELAWHAEIEVAPSKVLAHHHPDVPNLGDITQVDWTQVEPVDVLTGGFPCQDISAAGKRAGLKPGTRSGLWTHMAYAIRELRPALVVVENVRNLLNVEAHSDVEPCPWCVGDAGGEPALRALGAVLGDLADLGYDASWCGLQAADVGAPHGRFRVFLTAWPAADTANLGHERGGVARFGRPGSADRGGHAASDAAGAGRRGPWGSDPVAGDCGAADGGGGSPEPGRRPGVVADTYGSGPEGAESAAGRVVSARGAAADTAGDGRHEGRPWATGLLGGPDAALSGDAAATHTDSERQQGRQEHHSQPFDREAIHEQRRDDPAGLGVAVDWGTYGPAIHRWEAACGRRAPVPTIRGTKGQPKLNPAFVEWMMGLPAGYVTAVPGISVNEQLKMLGNGVVPQQAGAALSWLLGQSTRAGAA